MAPRLNILIPSGSKKGPRNVSFTDSSLEARISTKLVSSSFMQLYYVAWHWLLESSSFEVCAACLFSTAESVYDAEPQPGPDYCPSKRVVGKDDVLVYILVQEWLSYTVYDDGGREDVRNVWFAVEVMSGWVRWRSPEKIIQCCTIIARNLMKQSHLWRNVQTMNIKYV